jgi:hypothetical protein
VYSISYMSLIGGCLQGCTLSVSWAIVCRGYVKYVSYIGRLEVVCRWCEYCQFLTAGWLLSAGGCFVSYMMQIGDCLQGVCELCHILEASWKLSATVRVLRKFLDKDLRLSTAGVLCQLHKADRRFSAKGE